TGGAMVTLRDTSVLSPSVALESSLSSFDERPARLPNTGPDTNGNGVIYFDRNHNGQHELFERDPGEDRDMDGAFDVYEPKVVLDVSPGGIDVDSDGRRTPPGACEGRNREDVNCNGQLDPGEDRNHNGILDDTPHPTSLYPYGHLKPEISDRDYVIDSGSGVISGPYYEDFADSRRRATLRQDLSVFAPDLKGSHDVRMGYVVERETFDRKIVPREILGQYVPPNVGSGFIGPVPVSPKWPRCPGDSTKKCPDPIQVNAVFPAQDEYRNDASG